MKRTITIIAAAIIIFPMLISCSSTPKNTSSSPKNSNSNEATDHDDYVVASYYFPNYHVDARNEKVHGDGWTEWELVKAAGPRFEGHRQPKVPAWGYTDEADPADMEQKIDAAADHGLGQQSAHKAIRKL